VVSYGLELDFKEQTFNADRKDSPVIPLDYNPVSINLINTATPQCNNALLLILGIRFFTETNGKLYPLKNNEHNALRIIEAV
jgi:hypothetical protein